MSLTNNSELNERLNRLSPEQRALLALKLSRAGKRPGAAAAVALPRAEADPQNRFALFPLSDIQQAYLIGREEGVELGNIACHNYFEVDLAEWDEERFHAALNKLIQRHEMLRCIVLPEGQQQVLETVPDYRVKFADLAGEDAGSMEQFLAGVRREMSHYVHATDAWPLFEFRATRLSAETTRLHIGFDLLIADGRSFEIIFGDLAALYRDPGAELPPLELSFRDYLAAFRQLEDTEAFQTSRDYWMKRLPSLPASPDLPFAVNPAAVGKPEFSRRETSLEPAIWQSLKEKTARAGLTPAGILLAAYAEVLAIWSKSPHFTLNLTLFNRLPLHEQANDIVGDFTSVNLLEVDFSAPGTFQSRARRSQEQLWLDLDHRYFSGIRALRELSRIQGVGPKAIMPVVFTSILNLGNGAEEPTWVGRLGETGYTVGQTPQVCLDYMVQESAGRLLMHWDAVEKMFPQGLLDDLFAAYRQLVLDLATDESAWQRTLAQNAQRLIPEAQVAVRVAANQTAAPVSDDLLHTPFLNHVAQRPEQLAVCTPTRRLSYLELYRRACGVEQELLHCGAKPNDLVAVMMEKGWEQIVAVLGIHLAGAAYLPIDPELPAERQRFLLEHARVKVALTQSGVRGRLSLPESVQVFEVNRMEPVPASAPTDRRRQAPEDLAYVIYTSGSTGVPKGVVIDHRGALNTVLDINQRFAVGPSDRILAISRLSFDLSVYDVFGLLAAGGTIVMPSADLAYDATHWADLIAREKVTIWDTVPALLQLLVDQAGTPELFGTSLRLAMMSGDWIPLGVPDQIRRAFPDVEVVSLGGATEASIWSILFPVAKVDPGWKSIPYGKAMRNQSFHVLGPDFSPRPIWVPGQLYIGGIGLAKGYLHDEQKTNANFVENPQNGERLYRTGDLGRLLPDGNIEFLGREDFQVKVQGYRIELGEIESRLQEVPAIDLSIVTVREDTPGEKRLVAYVVPKPGTSIDTAEVKEHLHAKLPDYMVPAAILVLERFPLTANGKVDRKALPAPARAHAASVTESPALRDSLDMQLLNLWEKVLNVRPVRLRDNFFDLGGNSLVAVRLFSEMRKLFDRSFPLATLFQAPTVEKMADMIRKGGWFPQWDSVVPIQPGGSRPPFFCVHGGGGNVLIYRQLAHHLGKDYPFYGLQARGLYGRTDYLTSIDAMAEEYLRELRELQPAGPYFLGGFCMGGHVAYEMAQRLMREGQQVHLLFMIDSHNFNGHPPQPSLAENVGNLERKIRFRSSNDLPQGPGQRAGYLVEKSRIVARRQMERLRIWVEHTFKLYPHRDVTKGTKEEVISLINDRAYLRYVPGPYPGALTLSRPRRDYRFLRDSLNGWSGLPAGGLTLIELPCEPIDIFDEPFVRSLAETLRKSLEQAFSIEVLPVDGQAVRK